MIALILLNNVVALTRICHSKKITLKSPSIMREKLVKIEELQVSIQILKTNSEKKSSSRIFLSLRNKYQKYLLVLYLFGMKYSNFISEIMSFFTSMVKFARFSVALGDNLCASDFIFMIYDESICLLGFKNIVFQK